jgi:hypothetical protein
MIASREWTYPGDASGAPRQRSSFIVDVACDAFRFGPRTHAPARLDLLAESRSQSSEPLRAAHLLVLGPRSSDGADAAALVGRLRNSAPHILLYVCGTRLSGMLARQRELSLAGADELCTLDSPSERQLLESIVRQRLLVPVPADVVREATIVAEPGEGRTIALWCLRNGHRRRSTSTVADRFERHPKSLNALCRRAGFASVSDLLRLSLLYHQLELRRRSHLASDEIARRLGFATATALAMHRMRVRRAGLVPHAAGRWPDVSCAPSR